MAVYFSIILVAITAITGIIWLIDKFYLAPQRQLNVDDAQRQCSEELSPQVIEKLKEPSALVDTAVQIFPVIAFVMILRSFLYEPFQIPSGSMMPTLLDGDFILVNKFNYGLKDPVMRNQFIDIGTPERGDVVVFKYPVDPRIDYIKRVIGLPGDRIIYRDKTLFIKEACKESDKVCPDFIQIKQQSSGKYEGPGEAIGLNQYASTMMDKTHNILKDNFTLPRTTNYFNQAGTLPDEFFVPQGHYFVMGDNRDNSADGRFWGFVPKENLVGEAIAIWMSFDFDRSRDSVLPHWIPTNVRFNRIGAIN